MIRFLHSPSPPFSAAFEDGGPIPNEYLADDDNISPPLDLVDVPPNTKSFAIIVDDPGAAKGTGNHWIMVRAFHQMIRSICFRPAHHPLHCCPCPLSVQYTGDDQGGETLWYLTLTILSCGNSDHSFFRLMRRSAQVTAIPGLPSCSQQSRRLHRQATRRAAWAAWAAWVRWVGWVGWAAWVGWMGST